MVSYPALFDPDREAGGFVVTFPDFPYGVTQGESEEEATDMATDLLICLISDSIKKNAELPKASKPRGWNFRTISLPALQTVPRHRDPRTPPRLRPGRRNRHS